ncbi:MAG: Nif3-like dinuclear metal center hexameric protein [Bacteroidetes bacterium]|nr:Nif3-like dinuclear metal center hexameric protein [Bacteroidota bacterium]
MLENSGRRKFIRNTLKAAGAVTLFGTQNDLFAGTSYSKKEYTVQDVINILIKDIPGAPFKETVDTIKSGSAGNKVTGIVTTMFATVNVIEATAKLGANFIIAHEPTFYNHLDDIDFVAYNEVVKQKRELLKKHNITVWRFHDYIHSYQPDGIGLGVLQKAGWFSYYQPGKQVLAIPTISFKDLIGHLKKSLGIAYVRVIGDPDQQCSTIALLPGAAGGQRQIATVENQKPDVLIVGELSEWETAEYIRDARAFGSKTTLIVLGHSVSEEPGMEWLVGFLQPKIPEIKITHIISDNPFKLA